MARKHPKPGNWCPPKSRIEVTAKPRYVGRGGLKLEGALRHFGIDVTGLVAADFGSSTGGFTDCLLQAGRSARPCHRRGNRPTRLALAQRSARRRARRGQCPVY